MVKKLFAVTVVVLLAVYPFWAGAQSRQSRDPGPLIVKAGVVGVTGDAPFYVGVAKGFFEQQGIKLQLHRFRSGGDMMAPLGGGRLDVVRGGVNIGLFNSFARGWPVKVVAAGTVDLPGNSPDTVILRPDLKGAINRPGDLKGRKVAVNAPTSALVYVLGKMLERDGLTLKDVDMVTIPFGDMGVALKNKAIEVALAAEPFAALLAERGDAVIWKRVPDFVANPYFQVSVVFYNSDWAAANPQAAREFMVAWLKSVRYYYDAAKKGINRDEVIDIMIKNTAVRDRAVYDKVHWSIMDPNGWVLKESLVDQQEWYFRNGYVKQKANVDQMVDNTFVEYATKALGNYPVP